jgi:hypothetical protein
MELTAHQPKKSIGRQSPVLTEAGNGFTESRTYLYLAILSVLLK